MHRGESRIKMKTDMKNLRMKCSSSGHWNRVPVNKIFVEQPSLELRARLISRAIRP